MTSESENVVDTLPPVDTVPPDGFAEYTSVSPLDIFTSTFGMLYEYEPSGTPDMLMLLPELLPEYEPAFAVHEAPVGSPDSWNVMVPVPVNFIF
jgi:hypothetical protein